MFRWSLYGDRVSGPPPVRLCRWGSWWFMRLQSHYVWGALFTDSAWTIAVRVAIYDAPTFAPAVAHLGPSRGWFPFPWCCLASLVTFGGRQSPPPTNHRWPGSCARLASRSSFTVWYVGPIRVYTHSPIRDVKELVSVWRGLSPPTQDIEPVQKALPNRCTSLMLRSKCLK